MKIFFELLELEERKSPILHKKSIVDCDTVRIRGFELLREVIDGSGLNPGQ